MKIEKAIKIKRQWRKDNYPLPSADEMDADMLSIEALEYIQHRNNCPGINTRLLLPGETEE